MKVIDLLNKIANGEEVPKKIKFDKYIFELDKLNTNYISEWRRNLTFHLGQCQEYALNEQVEILDAEYEFKDIEELNLEQDELVNNKDIRAIDYLFEGTINQLIKNQKKIIERLKDYERRTTEDS